MRDLSKHLDENTYGIREELNYLEEAGLLSTQDERRPKVYRVNNLHQLTNDWSNILHKVTGISQMVDRVVLRLE